MKPYEPLITQVDYNMSDVGFATVRIEMAVDEYDTLDAVMELFNAGGKLPLPKALIKCPWCNNYWAPRKTNCIKCGGVVE